MLIFAYIPPLIPSQGIDHILTLIPKLNGVLFPGGNAGYVEIAEPVFREIIKLNDQGKFYPIWGTCLGYEYFV